VSTVLVIAAHPDDEAIGCGGSLALHVRGGDRVIASFLSSGELGIGHADRRANAEARELEAERAAAVLGIARLDFARLPDFQIAQHVDDAAAAIAALVADERPEIVYLPHGRDGHPDHEAVLPSLRAAAAQLGVYPVGRAYETWVPLDRVDYGIDICSAVDVKLAAIRCYRSQLSQRRYDRAVLGLNRYRGVMILAKQYAEAFEHISLEPGAPDRPFPGWSDPWRSSTNALRGPR
jgi:LmbE family N-acetylglucosaminyl deacetylase